MDLPMKVSCSRAPCSPHHCLHRCTIYHLHPILRCNHLQVTQEEYKVRHPNSALQKVLEGLVVGLNNLHLQVTSPTRDIPAKPTSRWTSFGWCPRQPVKVGKNVTKVWLGHSSHRKENQVMSPRESLTLQEKALCTKQPEYGETWCVKNVLLGSDNRNTSREQERQLIHE